MKILVCGNLGFIGSHVYWTLRSKGHDVVGVDRKESGRHLQDTGISGSYDIIIHAAANLFEDFGTNLQTTRYLIDRFPQSKIIFLSSAAVYGEANNVRETAPLSPFGEYGRIKSLEEMSIKKQAGDWVILRLANVYGYDSDHGIYQRFIRGDYRIYNGGKSVRDFVHVDDVVWMVEEAMSLSKEIVNVGSGKGVSVLELFNILCPYADPIFCPRPVEEIKHSVLDIEKARSYGYDPRCL